MISLSLSLHNDPERAGVVERAPSTAQLSGAPSPSPPQRSLRQRPGFCGGFYPTGHLPTRLDFSMLSLTHTQPRAIGHT